MTTSELFEQKPDPQVANGRQKLNTSVELECQLTPVSQMFHKRSVFITGGSGFIGRVLLEKLLRTYPTIKNVYILLRPKRNMTPAERLNKHLLNVPIFDHIRSLKEGQELLDKIVVVSGDIGEPRLGLADSDLKLLVDDKSLAIVFHAAATVRFDEPLQTSTRLNLMATESMVELCQQMPQLVALCHVSTAYVNSDVTDGTIIEEKIYPMRQSPAEVIMLSKLLDVEVMQQIKPALVCGRPNTYTYTKALAEHLVASKGAELPVAIVRPSIVVAAWKEPIPGWVDNLNGPTGLIVAIGKGLLRTMHTRRDCKADLVPVDIVVNTMIAAAYYAAKSNGKLGFQGETVASFPCAITPDEGQNIGQPAEHLAGDKAMAQSSMTTEARQNGLTGTTGSKLAASQNTGRVPPIFHCTSGDVKPITWGQIENTFPIIRKYPSRQVFRYPFGTFKETRVVDMATRLVVHYLPAMIIDLLCVIMGRKAQVVSIYHKLHAALEALSHFCTTNYNFQSNNIRLLQESLTHPDDKKALYMDMHKLDWFELWETYIIGARRYILKEGDQSLEEARKNFKRAWYMEMAFRTVLIVVVVALSWPFIGRPISTVLSCWFSVARV